MTDQLTALISGIKRMEIHDGEGLRTTVFFKGCPLACIWCHNPESMRTKPSLAIFTDKCIGCGSCTEVCPVGAIRDGVRTGVPCTLCGRCAQECPTEAVKLFGERIGMDALYERIIVDRPFFGKSGGVTLSGGECLMQAEFVTELARRLFDAGVSVDIDTCGYVDQEVLRGILPYTDTFLYDLKAITPEVHRRCTGRDNGIILNNLLYLSAAGAKIEIRYPLVVGYNDAEAEKIGALVRSLPTAVRVKVLRYHNLSASRYEALALLCTLPEPRTDDAAVAEALRRIRDQGVCAVDGRAAD